MKTIEQLEEEAKQAREDLCVEINRKLGLSSRDAGVIADNLILASVAMVTYQFALGMEEVSGDGSGESLPDVSQEERDSDGWIVWNGGSCPVDFNVEVEVRFRSSQYESMTYFAEGFVWRNRDDGTDIIAYRIVK